MYRREERARVFCVTRHCVMKHWKIIWVSSDFRDKKKTNDA